MLPTLALSLSAVAKNPFDNGSGGTVPLYVQPSYEGSRCRNGEVRRPRGRIAVRPPCTTTCR